MEAVFSLLKGLSPEQLDEVEAAVASERAAREAAEPKRVLWCVEDRYIQYERFPDSQYVQAAQYLLSKAQELAPKVGELSPKYLELRLTSMLVRADEYEEYLSTDMVKAAKAKGEVL